MINIRIQGEARFDARLFQEGETWVVYAPVFDLSSCGRTPEEAQRMLGEAITVFLSECIQEGKLDEVLEDLGWKKLPSGAWNPPKVVDVALPLPA